VAVKGIQKLSHSLEDFAKHPNPADPLFFEQLRRLRDTAKAGLESVSLSAAIQHMLNSRVLCQVVSQDGREATHVEPESIELCDIP
jgi:hypothetical protein